MRQVPSLLLQPAVRCKTAESVDFPYGTGFLLQISGIAILVIGSVILVSYNHYSAFVYSSYQSAPIVLIIVGVVVFVIAFFGCCGAVRENHCMIITVSPLF